MVCPDVGGRAGQPPVPKPPILVGLRAKGQAPLQTYYLSIKLCVPGISFLRNFVNLYQNIISRMKCYRWNNRFPFFEKQSRNQNMNKIYQRMPQKIL